ncbi:MAG TPA: enoyl-CoA hydratase-related protein [Isosphaeraceae bacterium]|nr:enoyl-CoA hydratase-related protein [Isosphaeraceae bacterium]
MHPEPHHHTAWVRLGDLAHARSGDKGDRSNIGVVAFDPARYAWLKGHLTETVVAEYFRPLGIGAVRRYELPKIHALNFVLENALGGGASRSLRLDSQGKALGVALLELRLPSPGAPGTERGPHDMSAPIVERADHGPVAVLTLNRPDRRNALSRALVDALSDALDRVAVEPGPRAVVLTGAGPAFCAGMDLKEALEASLGPEAERTAVADVQALADLIAQVHALPRPTIAALNGDAYAGGAGLATACDFVIASEGAKIGYPEVRRGLVAAIVMHDLVRQVGERRARALLLTGTAIDAAEAERWGLVNRVVPAGNQLDEALALGLGLAECGPLALQTTKRLIDEASGRPADLRGAAAVSAQVRVSDEAHEGLQAFLEKRPPRWSGPPQDPGSLGPHGSSPAIDG